LTSHVLRCLVSFHFPPIPLPPRTSTLFPYTTLFRSSHEQSTSENPESKRYAFDAGQRAVQAHYDRIGVKAEVLQGEYLGLYRTKDRKSTRLNSSHVSISYAVFCLKKKR